MSEKPILMSGPMVRAILAGKKVVTRRMVKLNESGRVKAKGKQWHLDDPEAVFSALGFIAGQFGEMADRLLLWLCNRLEDRWQTCLRWAKMRQPNTKVRDAVTPNSNPSEDDNSK